MQKLTGKKVFLNLGQPGTEFVYDLIGTNIHVMENFFDLGDKFYAVSISYSGTFETEWVSANIEYWY